MPSQEKYDKDKPVNQSRELQKLNNFQETF